MPNSNKSQLIIFNNYNYLNTPRKVLVFVNKTFLMTQWKEKIRQYIAKN